MSNFQNVSSFQNIIEFKTPMRTWVRAENKCGGIVAIYVKLSDTDQFGGFLFKYNKRCKFEVKEIWNTIVDASCDAQLNDDFN